MSDLRRIRDFKAPKDDASADELRRQLVQLETNISDMADTMNQAALQRLARGRVSTGTATTVGLFVSPGQFQFVDTRTGTVPLGLAKPSSGDAGTFVTLIDLGGAAGSVSVQGQGCKYENSTGATVLTVATWAALIFCDGTDYWRIF